MVAANEEKKNRFDTSQFKNELSDFYGNTRHFRISINWNFLTHEKIENRKHHRNHYAMFINLNSIDSILIIDIGECHCACMY